MLGQNISLWGGLVCIIALGRFGAGRDRVDFLYCFVVRVSFVWSFPLSHETRALSLCSLSRLSIGLYPLHLSCHDTTRIYYSRSESLAHCLLFAGRNTTPHTNKSITKREKDKPANQNYKKKLKSVKFLFNRSIVLVISYDLYNKRLLRILYS